MDWHVVVPFLAATLLLLITPGPVMATIAYNTLRGGSPDGLSTVIGVELGKLLVLSLTFAVLLLSGELFPSLVRWLALAGTAYLLWLALKALHFRSRAEQTVTCSGRPVVDGLAIACSNPATLVFYAAFFPQFISPDHSIAVQTLILGAIYIATSLAFEVILVITFARLRRFGFHGQSPIGAFAGFGSAVVYVAIATVTVFGLMRFPA